MNEQELKEWRDSLNPGDRVYYAGGIGAFGLIVEKKGPEHIIARGVDSPGIEYLMLSHITRFHPTIEDAFSACMDANSAITAQYNNDARVGMKAVALAAQWFGENKPE